MATTCLTLAQQKLGAHLAPIGVTQTYLAGARPAGLPSRFDELYLSPVRRARDTAAIIAVDFKGRQFEVVEDPSECMPPTWRMEITAQEKPQDLAARKIQMDRLFVQPPPRFTVLHPDVWQRCVV